MLKLSTRGRYGLRALIEIAHQYKNGPVLMGEIAKKQQFSQKYLHALLTSLKAAGLVTSKRGAHGGYLLAREPKDILMSEIFEALEGRISIIDCLTDPEQCDRQQICESYGLWKALNDTLKGFLRGITLQDILIYPRLGDIENDATCMLGDNAHAETRGG